MKIPQPNLVPASWESKKKKLAIFISLIVTICLVLIFLFKPAKKPKHKTSSSPTANLYNVTNAVDDKSYWVFASERKMVAQQKELEEQKKKQAALEEALSKLKQELEEKSMQATTEEENIDQGMNYLDEQYKSLDQARSYTYASSRAANDGIETIKNILTQEELPEPTPNIFYKPKIQLDSFGLNNREISSPFDFHIPASTLVKARMLSGVDGATGVKAQSNPYPVFMQIISSGYIGNKKTIPQLKGCMVTGAAYGDLSSERVLIRLENLTCALPGERVIESKVKGVVLGASSKHGVDGKKIHKTGKLLQKAALSGLFSGFGKGISEASRVHSVSPLGSTSAVDGIKNITKSALGEGTSNALANLSKYYIELAELYHPIIEVSAGREIHIGFLSSTDITEKNIEVIDRGVRGEY